MLRLRKILGKISRVINPGLGYCHRCGRTWNICDGHTVWYGKNSKEATRSGFFALCEECWSDLSPEARIPYYAYLVLLIWPRSYPLKARDGRRYLMSDGKVRWYKNVWSQVKKAILEEGKNA